MQVAAYVCSPLVELQAQWQCLAGLVAGSVAEIRGPIGALGRIVGGAAVPSLNAPLA